MLRISSSGAPTLTPAGSHERIGQSRRDDLLARRNVRTGAPEKLSMECG
jgi:hypothetical protein